MILLDTNVISALMQQRPDDAAVGWLDGPPAAVAAAGLAAKGRREERPVKVRDIQIAGIALARKAALATRNVRHFRDSGVELLNPWKSPPG